MNRQGVRSAIPGRVGALAQSVQIKHIDDAAVEPVIISQAADRQRVNNWWIFANAFVALLYRTCLRDIWLRYFMESTINMS